MQLNDEISKRTTEDQLNYETEVFSTKWFSKVQGFLRSVRKATTYPSEMSHAQNRARDDLNTAEPFNQIFHNLYSSKTKNTNQ